MISDFPVNKNPGQLLRFLGLSGPDAPNRVMDLIQGNVDLLPWWMLANEQTGSAQATPAAGATGLSATLTVPANQRWLLTRFTISTAQLVAGHTYSLVGVIQGIGGFSFPVGQSINVAALAFGYQDCFMGNGRTAWELANPGDDIGVNVIATVGATPAETRLRIRYVSFPL